MRNVHRVPLVSRRLFASSRSHNRDTKSPKSAFSARFESPSQASQSSQPQAAFPDWPGARPQQISSHTKNYTFRRPPPTNLLASFEGKEDDGGSGKDAPAGARGGRRKREIFSDCIGNASGFVNTHSYEAKPAIEPATETQKQLLHAVKSKLFLISSQPELTMYLYAGNMHRFHSLPESVDYKPDQNSISKNATDGPSTALSESDPAPKSPPRTSRFAAVSSSGRRMLSTRSAETPSSHVPLSTRPSLTILDRWTGVRHPSSSTKSTDTSLWRECLAWMLASTPCHYPYSPPPTRSFLRQANGACFHR